MPDECYEEKITMIALGPDVNVHRPLDAADLLELGAAKLRELYESQCKAAFPLQPFLVENIAIDITDGEIKLYLRDNG